MTGLTTLTGLSLGLALSVVRPLFGVVDQVDEGIALVEWDGRYFAPLPTALLPDTVGEGDAIALRVRRRRVVVRSVSVERVRKARIRRKR